MTYSSLRMSGVADTYPFYGGVCIVHAGREWVLRSKPVINIHDADLKLDANAAQMAVILLEVSDNPTW